MRKVLLAAVACSALLAATPANALFGSSSGSIFGNTVIQDAAYNFWNPSPTTGVNAIRPPGTEPLTNTANKVIYALFGVSKFTYIFGLR
ncbi:MAG: hypothetical protein R3D25_11740 [Geminicoccaceae bacterium]